MCASGKLYMKDVKPLAAQLFDANKNVFSVKDLA